jgi:hypothetical protein
MEHFAKSRFWRGFAAALILVLAYIGWSLAGDRTILPVAHAGGVVLGQGGYVFTTSEAGDVLYAWPIGQGGGAATSYVEQWSWAAGTVTRRPVRYYDQPGFGPVGPGGQVPPPPPPGESPNGRYGGNR